MQFTQIYIKTNKNNNKIPSNRSSSFTLKKIYIRL